MADYNIEEAFARIEEQLVNDVITSIKTANSGHMKAGKSSVWKANQLKELQNFKKRNKTLFTKDNSADLYKQINDQLREAYAKGAKGTEKQILKKIEDGLITRTPKDFTEATFNGVNDRKLNALIKETQDRLEEARYSALRYTEDQYRKIIFDSTVYLETGTGTLSKAIDMATKDFLIKGIQNIEYADGRRTNIQSYVEMALRTAEKRSYMQGEAAMRDEYGLGLVIVTRRGNACPKCMQFVGKVFNDDVYGSVKANPKYPLLSSAIAGGLYHPNCRDVHTTYFEDITTVRPEPTAAEKKEAERIYNLEQQQRYNERQIRKYKRLATGSLDEENQKHYGDKVRQWQKIQRDLINSEPKLRRKYDREKVISLPEGTTITPVKTIRPTSDFNVELKLKNIPKDLLEEQEKQINYLLNKYGDSDTTLHIISDGRLGNADAYYHSSIENGKYSINELKLNTKKGKSFNRSKEEFILEEEFYTKKKWFINKDSDRMVHSTITHEWGHYIERQMARKLTEAGKLNLKTLQDWHSFTDSIQREIEDLYKKRTGNSIIKDNLMSRYGLSNSREFFAEAFTNYELDSNCKFKPEMDAILKKYGIL